jgi:hypothetical protein
MTDVDVVVIDDEGDAHGDAVLAELEALGAHSLRYSLDDLRSVPFCLQRGSLDLYASGGWQRITSGTSVWWRRIGTVEVSDLDPEEARLASDEAPHLLRGALMCAGVRWVDDPFHVERAELKLNQLCVAASLGIATPATMTTSDLSAARTFATGRRVIAKPLSPGQGIAPFVTELEEQDLDLVMGLPTLLQESVLASADLRVVVVGADAWIWRRQRGTSTIDWRAEDPQGVEFSRTEDEATARGALSINSALGLSMSAQDWLETDNGPVFLEANPQGAWLFLEGAPILVAAVARHLTQPPMQTEGVWPRAIKRFVWDFLPEKKAPQNDGVVAPNFASPTWAHEAARRAEALDVAKRAHDEAKSGAKVAEDKASRLVQTALALLAITLAVGAYQVQFALDRSLPWILSMAPIIAALACLALAAFEALEIDRVGMYRHPTAADLSRRGSQDPRAELIAEEEIGRRLARWTSMNKHSDLMQARAWFSRGLAALIVAGLLAAISRAAVQDQAGSGVPPTTAPSLTATGRQGAASQVSPSTSVGGSAPDLGPPAGSSAP